METNKTDFRQDVNQMDTFTDSRDYSFFWTPAYLNRAVGTVVKLPLTFQVKASSLCGGISYPTDFFCNTLPPVVSTALDAHSDRRLPLFSIRQRDLYQTTYLDGELCFCASSCGLKDCEILKFNLKRHFPVFRHIYALEGRDGSRIFPARN